MSEEHEKHVETDEEPVVLILTLSSGLGDVTHNPKVFRKNRSSPSIEEALTERAIIKRLTTCDEAVAYLTNNTPYAIIIQNGSYGDKRYRAAAEILKKYVREGGTAVFVASFGYIYDGCYPDVYWSVGYGKLWSITDKARCEENENTRIIVELPGYQDESVQLSMVDQQGVRDMCVVGEYAGKYYASGAGVDEVDFLWTPTFFRIVQEDTDFESDQYDQFSVETVLAMCGFETLVSDDEELSPWDPWRIR